MKNKPFFIIRFTKEVNCDDFNKMYSKNKRTKAKLVAEDAL
jgi:hypothetical protein